MSNSECLPALKSVVKIYTNFLKLTLQAIFKRDIEDNLKFAFRSWRIYPIKVQGGADMGRLFKHFTFLQITPYTHTEKSFIHPLNIQQISLSLKMLNILVYCFTI